MQGIALAYVAAFFGLVGYSQAATFERDTGRRPSPSVPSPRWFSSSGNGTPCGSRAGLPICAEFQRVRSPPRTNRSDRRRRNRNGRLRGTGFHVCNSSGCRAPSSIRPTPTSSTSSACRSRNNRGYRRRPGGRVLSRSCLPTEAAAEPTSFRARHSLRRARAGTRFSVAARTRLAAQCLRSSRNFVNVSVSVFAPHE
jgi:hypothetical protein